MNAAPTSRLPLRALGALVRATRINKGLSQQQAAARAGVSRKQWALLEGGHNASAEFIQKVATFLDLHLVPLGDELEATLGAGGGGDVTALFELADALVTVTTIVVERIRAFALEVAMPPSQRGVDASAISGLLGGRDDEAARHRAALTRALQNLAGEAVPQRPPAGPAEVSRPTVRGKRGEKRRA